MNAAIRHAQSGNVVIRFYINGSFRVAELKFMQADLSIIKAQRECGLEIFEMHSTDFRTCSASQNNAASSTVTCPLEHCPIGAATLNTRLTLKMHSFIHLVNTLKN